MTPAQTSSRIDFWLWCVRVAKTRSKAKDLCLAGHVSVDGQKAKPSTAVIVGREVTVVTPGAKKSFTVLALPPTRVSAAAVAAFALDTSPAPIQKIPGVPAAGENRARGLGRPTKRDRRQIDSLKRGRQRYDDW